MACCEDSRLIRGRETKEPDFWLTRGRDILRFQPAVFVVDEDRNGSTLEIELLVASAFLHEALKCNPGVERLRWELLQLDLNQRMIRIASNDNVVVLALVRSIEKLLSPTHAPDIGEKSAVPSLSKRLELIHPKCA